jgi:regulator of protease activity HflC (stomatin/prohibitin superfamily)
VTIFSQLGELLSWLAAWFPRLLILKSSEAGVKYVHGWRVVPLGPGLHLFWPLVTVVQKTAIVRQLLNLTTQTLVTEDGKVVNVSGLVVYRITDVVKFLAENENSFESIDDAATGAIARVVVSKGFEELRQGRAAIEKRLTTECQKVLEDFGVEVEYARLSDFAPTRVLNLAGQPVVSIESGRAA